MLSYNEYLLDVAGEECSEIIQELSKCIRFGPNNVDPSVKNADTHAHNVMKEYEQLRAVMDMLIQRGVLNRFSQQESRDIRNAKKHKVSKYYKQYENKKKTNTAQKSNNLYQPK